MRGTTSFVHAGRLRIYVWRKFSVGGVRILPGWTRYGSLESM